MRTGYVCSCLNCFICINKHWICRYNLIMDFSSQIPGYQCFVLATGLHVSAFMLVSLTGKSLHFSLWTNLKVSNDKQQNFNPLLFQTICKSEPSKHMCSQRVWPVVWRTLQFTAWVKYFELTFLGVYFNVFLAFSPVWEKSEAANTDMQTSTC